MPTQKSRKPPASKKSAAAGKKSASKKSASKKSAGKKSASKSRAASKSGSSSGALSVSQFLGSRPSGGGYSAVFLINPLESTRETLRVAWPETCIVCGNWFDFPASAVEAIIPLGVEECCNTPFPKAALLIDPRRDDLIRMLRSHLTGTIGHEMATQAPVQAEGFGLAGDAEAGESEVCGSEEPVAAAPQGFGIGEGMMGAADATTFELSGPQWVARFPGSRSVFDTKPPFLDKLSKFHAALVAAGAAVSISATFRPPERAYLMHFSFRIAKEGLDPRTVPPMAGVNIQWFHGDLARSKSAAAQMVAAYGIVFRPALHSRHTEGFAIDMNVSWGGVLSIKTAGGVVKNIGAPRTGLNAALHQVGATYGVVKHPTDKPHWSSDGR